MFVFTFYRVVPGIRRFTRCSGIRVSGINPEQGLFIDWKTEFTRFRVRRDMNLCWVRRASIRRTGTSSPSRCHARGSDSGHGKGRPHTSCQYNSLQFQAKVLGAGLTNTPVVRVWRTVTSGSSGVGLTGF